MKRELVEIENSIYIPFDWKDPTPGGRNIGRAEFQVCLKHDPKRELWEFWVDPIQTRLKEWWHMPPYEYDNFRITSYDRLNDPNVWIWQYCKEHKTMSFSVYAPNDAKYLYIDRYGLSFRRDK